MLDSAGCFPAANHQQHLGQPHAGKSPSSGARAVIQPARYLGPANSSTLPERRGEYGTWIRSHGKLPEHGPASLFFLREAKKPLWWFTTQNFTRSPSNHDDVLINVLLEFPKSFRRTHQRTPAALPTQIVFSTQRILHCVLQEWSWRPYLLLLLFSKSSPCALPIPTSVQRQSCCSPAHSFSKLYQLNSYPL